jgi:proline racemase
MHARGQAKVGDTLVARSIIDSEFTGRIEQELTIANKLAIRPSISGRAWLTGTSHLILDSDDPWPEGYRLSDTWPDLLKAPS